jgi:cell division protein FtsW
VVYGLTFKVGLQVMLNVAVVTNSMPNTGISLPFFSYGGTSLILQIVEVAIILAISRYSTHQKI